MLWGQTLFYGDNFSLLVPGKLFTAFWIRQGIVPFWNPFLFAGINWIGDITQSVVYPSTVFFAALEPATAVNVTIVAQLLFSGWGMWLLARDWRPSLGGKLVVVFLWILSTQLTGSINNLATIQALSWLPWVIWAGQGVGRRPQAPWLLGVAVMGQFLAGYPQHVLYGVVAGVVFSGYLSWGKVSKWQWWWAWVQAGFWTVSLSAVAWMAFVPTLLASTRLEQTTAQSASGSLQPAMLLKAVLPFVFDKPMAGMKWGPAWSGQPNMVFYVTGIGWMMLASHLSRIGMVLGQRLRQRQSLRLAVWREDWWWLAIVLVTLVVAVGNYFPGVTALQQAIPLLRAGRYPSMSLIISTVALAVWVGRAYEQWRSWWPRWWQWLLAVGLSAGGGAAVGLWLSAVFWWPAVWGAFNDVLGGRLAASPFHTLARDQVIALVVSQDVGFVALTTLVGWWCLRRGWRAAVLAVLVVDLLFHAAGQFIWAPRAVYPTWAEITSQYGQLVGHPIDPLARYLTRNGNMPYTDFGSYWEALIVRAPFSDSFVDAVERTSFSHPMRLRHGLTPNWQMVYGVPVLHGYTSLLPADFARIWINPSQTDNAKSARINFINYVPLDHPELWRWAVQGYLVDTWFKVTEPLANYPMEWQTANWRSHQLLGLSRVHYGDQSSVALVDWRATPNDWQLVFTNDRGQQQLVIADRYEPGWEAWVNGRRVPISNVDGQRVLAIDPGANVVRMTYIPYWWYGGLWLTGLALILRLRLWRQQRSRHGADASLV